MLKYLTYHSKDLKIYKTEALAAMSVLYVKIKDGIYETEALAAMNGLYDLCITKLNKFTVG